MASMVGAHLKAMMIHLARHIIRQTTQTKSHVKTYEFEQFIGLVDLHLRDQWLVTQYAEAMGLSSGQLNRICQRHADQQALAIIHEKTIDEAKRQLIFTQLSAKEVAYKLGFKDPGYFSRFFSRRVGMSPKAYRNKVIADTQK